jgi:hypothetical protein
MNYFVVSLHLEGELPPNNELIEILGDTVTIQRKGAILRNGTINPEDRAFLDIARWEVIPYGEYAEGIKRFTEIATLLQALKPALQSLKEVEVTKWLRLGMVRRTDQGGITFPPELVSSLAGMGMSLHISMTVILDDDRDDGGDEPYDDDPISDPDVGVVVS